MEKNVGSSSLTAWTDGMCVGMNVEVGDETSGEVSSEWAAALPHLGKYSIQLLYVKEFLSIL